MPVGRSEDDGRPGRAFRGKPNPLGVATEWPCPTCGQKNEGRTLEEGCAHCGMGTPPTAEERAQGVPATATRTHPNAAHVDDRFAQTHPTKVQMPEVDPPASRPGVQTPVFRADAGPSKPAVERAAEPLVVTRIIQYTAKLGHEDWLMQTLQRSLVGKINMPFGSITAAVVDDLSVRQQDLLGIFSRQPGVWLSGPGHDVDRGINPASILERAHQASLLTVRPDIHPITGKRTMAPTPAPPPNTGPAFSKTVQMMAELLVQQCGLQVAYTIALALQNYSELVKGEAFEPGKQLDAEGCLSFANALMQLIPDDWDPEIDIAAAERGPQST